MEKNKTLAKELADRIYAAMVECFNNEIHYHVSEPSESDYHIHSYHELEQLKALLEKILDGNDGKSTGGDVGRESLNG